MRFCLTFDSVHVMLLHLCALVQHFAAFSAKVCVTFFTIQQGNLLLAVATVRCILHACLLACFKSQSDRDETTTTKKGCGNGCIINPHHTFTSHPILHLPDSFVAFVRVLLLKSGDAASKKGGSVLERGKVGSDAALDSAPRLWGGCRCAGAAAQRINGEAIPQLQRRELPCIRESGSGLAAVCAFPKP